MKTLVLKTFALLALVVCSCKKLASIETNSFVSEPTSEIQKIEQLTSYTTNPEYKYEYRVDDGDNYKYNYDVIGNDSNGDEVSGNVSVAGKYGTGTITDSNGNTFEIETEWIVYGKLKATDEDGNEYEIEVKD